MDFMNSQQNEFEPEQTDVEQNKVLALLSYIGILFLIPMFGAKNSQYAQYHAKQGLNMFVVFLIAGIAVSIVGAVINLIPILGWIVCALLGFIFSIAWLATMVVGIVNAVNGRTIPPLFMGSIRLFK